MTPSTNTDDHVLLTCFHCWCLLNNRYWIVNFKVQVEMYPELSKHCWMCTCVNGHQHTRSPCNQCCKLPAVKIPWVLNQKMRNNQHLSWPCPLFFDLIPKPLSQSTGQFGTFLDTWLVSQNTNQNKWINQSKLTKSYVTYSTSDNVSWDMPIILRPTLSLGKVLSCFVVCLQHFLAWWWWKGANGEMFVF